MSFDPNLAGKEVVKDQHTLGIELHEHFNNEAEKLKQREVDLAQKVKEARAYLDESSDRFKKAWLDWIDDSKRAIEDSRLTRLALEEEARRIKAAVKDMREVFEQHKDVIASSAELVRSFERMHELDKAGFFNRMSDVFVKLV